MPSFRYVVAEVLTDTPLDGNGVAVFTDARERPVERLELSLGNSTSRSGGHRGPAAV